MRAFNYPVIFILLLQLITQQADAQLFPGMKVNGRTVAQGDTVNVCKGSTLTYETTAFGFSSIFWRFDLGTPASATGFAPQIITYNTIGIDTTTQLITNGLNSDSMYIFVRVSDEKPVASYNFSPDDVCGNIPIVFSNNSSGLRNTYLWNFDDGTTSGALSPTHQFLTAIGPSGSQVFNVKLIASNFYGCKDSAIKPVTIRKIPDASIGNADPGVTYIAASSTFKVCTNTPTYNFKFLNQSTTIASNVTYNINWGDGGNDSTFSSWPAGDIIQHTYTIGSRILTVSVTGPSGCIGIKKYTVFLGTNPAGGFNSLGNTNICAPDSLGFVISGYQGNAPGTTYTVTLNDGTAPLVFVHPPPDTVIHSFIYSSCGTTSSNGTITFNNSYNAILTIENPCDLTSVSVIPIYVSGKPRARFIVNPSNTVCTGSPVTIRSTSLYGGIVTSTGGGNSTCENTGKQVWDISPATGYTIVGGNMGSLNGNPNNGFVWTSGTVNINLEFTATGTYTVRLYVFNDRCGIDSTIQTICVRNPPVASFTMSSRSACLSGNAVFTNTSPIGLCQGESYEWTVAYTDPLGCGNSSTTNYSFINGTSSTSSNADIQFDAPGKYAVMLAVGAIGSGSACAKAVKIDTFTVKGRPKVSINLLNSICVNTSASPAATVSPCYADSALQYAWTFTNGSPATSIAAVPGAVNYNQTGNFPIQLTVTNECGNGSSASSIDVIEPPVANAGNDTTVCQNNSSITLVATPAGGTWSGTALITAGGNFTTSTSGSYDLIYTFGAGPCTAKDTVTVVVKDAISNNLISPNQSVCVNTQPAIINGQVATGGDGTPAYQWQQSIDSLSWADIPGATALDFMPPILATTTFYRRVAFTTLCAGTQGSFSVPVKVTIREDANADFTASSTLGCIPYVLNNVIAVTTYPDRNGQYQWFADNIPIGNNITGVFPAYTMNAADDTTVIKLIVTSPFGCLQDTQLIQFITSAASFAKFIKDTVGGCGPVTVAFNNISSNFNNIQFFWDFGNGTLSNLPQPGSIVYNSSPFFSDTTYQVSLKAYNGCDTTTWRDSVKIKSKPKSRFGVVSTFGCSPFTVQISNNSLGANNTYYWDFGNGHKDTSFAPGPLNYTYNTGNVVDTLTIRMIAVNECGSDTQSIDIRIAPNIIRPQININSSELFGCAPHIINFINSTSGATSYTWDFGDATAPLITGNNQVLITHTYTDSGTYTVKIDLTNGCTDTTVFRAITVYKKPTAAFAPSAAVYCLSDTVKVNNTSANANSYTWFWGDGQSSTGSNPSHVYPVAGNYTIYLRAERTNNSGLVCYDTTVRFITVLIKPDVRVQSNVAVVNCVPFILNVSAPGIINETATWYIYDSTVSPSLIVVNGTSTQYTFNKPGTFFAKFIAVNALGCKDSSIVNFTVRGTPGASFTPGNFSICTLDTTIAYVNTTTYNDNGPLNYRWIVDNLQLSANGNFTHRYTLPANAILPRTFTTLLIAGNTVGCSDTARAVLEMKPSSTAQFTLNNPAACVPFAANITDASQYATSYKWYVNGVLTDTTANPLINIAQAQTLHTITLITDNIYGCKPDTFSVSFTSRIKPSAAFKLTDTLGCTGLLSLATINQTRFANSYVWDWGDNSPTSTLTSPTHLYNVQGQYLISLIASDGVCRDTADQLVRVSVKPVVDFDVSDTLTCDTARVQFINLTNGAGNFLWSFSDGSNSTDIAPSHSFAPSLTPYSVKLVADNGLGCKDSLTRANLIVAKVPPAADFFISPSAVITVPKYTFSFNNLTPNSNRFFYQWNLGDGTFDSTYNVINHKYTDTGNYAVQLIVFDTTTNCADTIIRIARIDGFPGYLYVPNAICPGCIQSNLREFLPKGKGLLQYRLQIFTTWNELIFETTSLDTDGAPNKSWDGRYKGQLVQQDVYVWRIDARFLNGTEWIGMIYPGEGQYKKVGTITVVK
ncbi:MAG: PKD domain-containing protein [Chitinophagaceae bacterium]|nr:PKD domain-containing protein [Chitinophagaceae bacterium]